MRITIDRYIDEDTNCVSVFEARKVTYNTKDAKFIFEGARHITGGDTFTLILQIDRELSVEVTE